MSSGKEKGKNQAGFNPVQASNFLGIATWQFDAAVRCGLIPPADFRGRWSVALLEVLAKRLPWLLAQVGEEPLIGSNLAAKRLGLRLDLDIVPADVEVLVKRNLLAISGYYDKWPLYDVRDLDHIADQWVEVLIGIVAERQAWQAASLDRRAACARLGWWHDEFDRVVAERGIKPGRFGRFARADVEDLATDRNLAERVLSDRLLVPDQASEYLRIRRVDFDFLGLAGLIAPKTAKLMRVDRYRKATVPLYRVGDLDALLGMPGLDWEAVRSCKEGEPSPLRELVTGRPTRSQIIRRFVAELGERLGIEVWARRNGVTDQWEIGWEELEPGNPSKAEILEAITADKAVAQFCADIALSVEAGAAVTWARKILQSDVACLLDIETVDWRAPACEIAVIDAFTSETLINSLVNPGVPISHSAFKTHGISDADVAESPAWPDVLPELLRVTKGRKILAYNADYDIRIIRMECRRYDLHPGHLGDRRNWDCVMSRRSDWLGTRRWLPLGSSHRALGDCHSALDIVRSLAVPPCSADSS